MAQSSSQVPVPVHNDVLQAALVRNIQPAAVAPAAPAEPLAQVQQHPAEQAQPEVPAVVGQVERPVSVFSEALLIFARYLSHLFYWHSIRALFCGCLFTFALVSQFLRFVLAIYVLTFVKYKIYSRLVPRRVVYCKFARFLAIRHVFDLCLMF